MNVVPMPCPPQPWPPQDCGCQDDCPDLGQLPECWAQIQALKKLIQDILEDMVLTTPIQGITDGSQAAQGMVGEFVTNTVQITVAAGTLVTNVFSVLVLQPGDWDVEALCDVAFIASFARYDLTIVPPGLSGRLSGWNDSVGSQDLGLLLPSGFQQANVTVPTLLAFQTVVTSTTGGPLVMTVNARRRR